MAISLVQSVATSANGASSVTVTISSTGSGNLLLVQTNSSNSAVTLALTYTGTSQTPTSIANPKPGNGQAQAWYIPSSASGTTAIIITRSSGSGQLSAIVREISGIATSTPLDQSTSAINGTPATTGTTATTTQADEFWWAAFSSLGFADGSQPTYAAISSPWTDGITSASSAASPNSNTSVHDGYQIVSATGTANATVSVTANADLNGWDGIVATFKAAAAGTSLPDGTRHMQPMQANLIGW